MKNKKKWMALLVMMLVAAMSLSACGKDDVSAENTSGYEQTERSSQEESLESASDAEEESTVVESSDKTTETIESTESQAVEESTEATTESEESTKESVTETTESTKEFVAPSKEQESAKPSKEETEPSVSAPSVEQTTPSVEQSTPSTPAVHTCNYGSSSVTKAATCTADGVKTYTCSCGASKTETIGKTGHNYVTESQAATCTTDGYEKTACSMCGDVKSQSTTVATGHTMVEKWFPAAPDCTYGGGMHWESCDKCGHRVDLPDGVPLGHTPDAGTVVREATCDSKSLLEYYCIRCGSKMHEAEGELNPNNHDWGWDEEEQEWYCAGCGITK